MTMAVPEFLNLFIYSDSLAFRRHGQSQDIAFTYPFVLARLIESELGIRANLVLRGGGGAAVGDIGATLTRDTGYFGASADAINIAVIQCGIVDCAPRPITYKLAPVLRKVPIAGERVLGALVSRRRAIQARWSYRLTPPGAFAAEYRRIVQLCHASMLRPVAVGLPLPTLAIERRSPGFRSSASIYNDLIRQALPESFCDVEQQITESQRDALLLDDGHHLTEAGHRLYAESLLAVLRKHV